MRTTQHALFVDFSNFVYRHTFSLSHETGWSYFEAIILIVLFSIVENELLFISHVIYILLLSVLSLTKFYLFIVINVKANINIDKCTLFLFLLYLLYFRTMCKNCIASFIYLEWEYGLRKGKVLILFHYVFFSLLKWIAILFFLLLIIYLYYWAFCH